MRLPDDSVTQYRSKMRRIEALLKDATSPDIDHDAVVLVQRDLDKLAEKFQHDESLSSDRYKLYELQALIHYFNDQDDKAMNFIEQAEYMRGGPYPDAERLRSRIHSPTIQLESEDTSTLSKSERRKRLIGLDGWLAFFCVGIGLSILFNLFGLYGYSEAFNNFSLADAQMPGIAAATSPLLWLEIVVSISLVVLEILLLVFLGKHKRSAKTLAIVILIVAPIWGILDYAWTYSLFQTYGLNESSLSSVSGDVGKSIIAVFIWIPYFLVSKRVKATLTH